MHKKILSVGLAGLMAMSIATPSVFAYSTDVNYDGHLQEQRLDIDGDNTEDITINDQVTYGIKVPATVNVDGPDDTAAIAGVIDTSVTLTAPESLEMTQDEVSANKLTALVNMGEDNTLILGTSTQKISRVTAGVNSKWDNNKPLMGNWSGSFEYNINQIPRDTKNQGVAKDYVKLNKVYKAVNNSANTDNGFQYAITFDEPITINDNGNNVVLQGSKTTNLYSGVSSIVPTYIWTEDAINGYSQMDDYPFQGNTIDDVNAFYNDLYVQFGLPENYKDLYLINQTAQINFGPVYFINSMDEYREEWNDFPVMLLDETISPDSIIAKYTAEQ